MGTLGEEGMKYGESKLGVEDLNEIQLFVRSSSASLNGEG